MTNKIKSRKFQNIINITRALLMKSMFLIKFFLWLSIMPANLALLNEKLYYFIDIFGFCPLNLCFNIEEISL